MTPDHSATDAVLTKRRYLNIVTYYESCLAHFGDNHLGVDWACGRDADTRYQVMLDVIREPSGQTVSLLDFGCGASHLLDFISRQGITGIDYSGLDLSPAFIDLSRRKHPDIPYYCVDVLDNLEPLPCFDYVIMNGVFTQKLDLPGEDMLTYLSALLEKAFGLARRGLAFNVMSAHLGWERPNLFHLPFDQLAGMLTAKLWGNFVVRNDYGLPEYTVYLYRARESVVVRGEG